MCGVLFNFIKINFLVWVLIIFNVIKYFYYFFFNFFIFINVNIFSEFDCLVLKYVEFFFSKWFLELLGYISCKYVY